MSEIPQITHITQENTGFKKIEELWKMGEKSGNYALYLRALDDYLLGAFVLPSNKMNSELSNVIDAMIEKLRPLIFNEDDSYVTNISQERLEESGFMLEYVRQMLGRDSEKVIADHNTLLRDVILRANKRGTRH